MFNAFRVAGFGLAFSLLAGAVQAFQTDPSTPSQEVRAGASESHNIGNDGAYRTSVDLKIPSFRGLEPKLSLSYNSSDKSQGHPYAVLGLGWRIDGLSVIERRSSSGGAPTYTRENDVFLLDGEELLACPSFHSGTTSWPYPEKYRANGTASSCAAGGQFTTLREKHLKITRSGEDTARDSEFHVFDKDGTRFRYQSVGTLANVSGSSGSTDFDITARRVWLLTEISDTQQTPNIVTISYGFNSAWNGRVHRPQMIEYGGYRTWLNYADTGMAITSFATGKSIARQTHRLQSVVVRDFLGGNTQIRAYQINYSQPTGQVQSVHLDSVREFGNDAIITGGAVTGGTALPAHSFAYRADDLKYQTALTGRADFHTTLVVTDVNSSGRENVLFFPFNYSSQAGSYNQPQRRYSANASSTLFNQAVTLPALSFNATDENSTDETVDQVSLIGVTQPHTSFNDDRFVLTLTTSASGEATTGASVQLYRMTTTGSVGSAPVSTLMVPDDTRTACMTQNGYLGPLGLGNFDYDHDSELVLFNRFYDVQLVNNIPTLVLLPGRRGDLEQVCSLAAQPVVLWSGQETTHKDRIKIADFSGNGIHEILVGKEMYRLTGSSYIRINDPSSPLPEPGFSGSTGQLVSSDFVTGDINGDGIDDIVWHYRGSNSSGSGRHLTVFLGTGGGFASGSVWMNENTSHFYPVKNDAGRGNVRTMLADLNGDGLADFLMHTGYSSASVRDSSSPLDPLSMRAFLSTGRSLTAFFFGPSSGQASPYGYIPNFLGIADVNGDGRHDIVYRRDGEVSDTIAMTTTATGQPNLLASVTTPLGSVTEITYSPSTHFAQVDMPYVEQVVTRLRVSDGRGQWRQTDFSYVNGRYDHHWRKPLGFQTVEATLPSIPGESTRPRIVRIYSNTNAAEQGLLLSETYFLGTTTLRRKINTWQISTQRPFRRFKTFERSADVYGGTLIETGRSYSYTTYGEHETVTEHGFTNNGANRSDHDDVVINYAYSENASAYIVNRPWRRLVYFGPLNWNDKTTFLSLEYFKYDDAANTENTQPIRGNLTEVRAWMGYPANLNQRVERQFVYDPHGNLTVERDARGAAASPQYGTTHIYDTQRQLFRTRTTNAAGHQANWTWNTRCQLMSTERNANNQTTQFTYDAMCRETERTFPIELAEGDRHYIRNSFVDLGNPSSQYTRKVERSAGQTSGQTETVSAEFFDGLGQVWKIGRTGRTSQFTTQSNARGELRAYDARGNLQWASIPLTWEQADTTGYTPTASQRTTYSYDPLNRKTRETFANNALNELSYVTLSFNDIGTSMPYPGVRTQDAHCFDGIETNICGDLAVFKDHQGNMVRQIRYENNSVVETSRYIHDRLGRLITILDPMNARWDYTYDVFGNRLTASDPGLGAWTMAYDDNGNLTTQTDAAGQQIFFTYDSINRATLKRVGSGSSRVETHSTFDQARTGYWNIGMETRQEVWLGGLTGILQHRIERDYQHHGNFAREVHSIDGRNYTLTNLYHQNGALLRQTLPARPGLNPPTLTVGDYQYDAASRLTGIGSLITAITYNHWDNPTKMDFGNGAYEETVYHSNRGWITHIRGFNQSAQRQMRSDYVRSLTGRITQHQTDTHPDYFSFTYDYAGRLLTVTNDRNLLQNNLVMTYDRAGRMLSKGQAQANATTYTYNASRPFHAPLRITTSGVNSNFSYDANGNMLTGLDAKAMTYDGENRPLSVTLNGARTCYVYGADGKRLKKIEGLTTATSCNVATLPSTAKVTVYFGSVELRNFGSADEGLILHPHSRFRLATNTNTAPVANYFFIDALGSVRVVLDVAGARVENHSFTPWGEKSPWLAAVQTLSESKGWIGERFDEDAGLQYLNARYYDPKLGLFLQRDWFEVNAPGVD